jgi:3',5'-cyclic AMP phosphodiesterase CpdA
MKSFSRRKFLTIGLPALGVVPLMAQGKKDGCQLRFGVIADPQYADIEPRGARHYRASLEKLEQAIEELNRHELAFTITLGDLIDRDFKSFDPVLERYRKLKSPHRILPGNHDFAVADDLKPKVLERLGLKSGYQSFSHDKWRLVIIDGTEISTYRYGPDAAEAQEAKMMLEEVKARGGPNAQIWNGGVSGRQVDWLERELSEAKAAGQRVIMAGHFPLLPEKDSHRLWNADAVVKVIDRHPHVAAYLNGHNHKGNYAHSGKCHYVNFKGMVENGGENAFAIVSCYEDHIEIDGYGPEPDRERLD